MYLGFSNISAAKTGNWMGLSVTSATSDLNISDERRSCLSKGVKLVLKYLGHVIDAVWFVTAERRKKTVHPVDSTTVVVEHSTGLVEDHQSGGKVYHHSIDGVLHHRGCS